MMLEHHDSVDLTGPQIRKILALMDSLGSPNEDDAAENITLAARPVFDRGARVVYASIVRWKGGGGRSDRIEVYLDEHGDELARKDAPDER